jgi:hypothetical protein
MPNLLPTKDEALNYDPIKEQQTGFNNQSALGKLGTAATMATGGVGGIAAGGMSALRREAMTGKAAGAGVDWQQINRVPNIGAPTPQSNLAKAMSTPTDTNPATTLADDPTAMRPEQTAAPAIGITPTSNITRTLVPESLKGIFSTASQATGIDQGYLEKMAKRESNFNANASNPGGSASGLMQFTDPTWQRMVKQFGTQYGLTPDGKNDAQQSAIAGALYAKQNKQMLNMALGIDATNADLYTAHFLGPQGAATFLRASYVNPDKPVTAVLPGAVINANKSVFLNKDGSPKTVGQVHTQIEDEFNV